MQGTNLGMEQDLPLQGRPMNAGEIDRLLQDKDDGPLCPFYVDLKPCCARLLVGSCQGGKPFIVNNVLLTHNNVLLLLSIELKTAECIDVGVYTYRTSVRWRMVLA